MTAAEHPPVRSDRVTLPLLRVAVLVGLALTAWPAAVADGLRWAWVIAFPVGLLVARLPWHPFRVLGLVPLALTGAVLSTVAAAVWGWCDISAGLIGFATGVAAGVFLQPRPIWSVADVSPAVVGLAYWAAAAGALVPVVCIRAGYAAPDTVRQACTIAAAVVFGLAGVFAWVQFFRPLFEFCIVPPLVTMYHIRYAGPGVAAFPATGPCLIVANHACWFDPAFLARILPRPLTPMMTSVFYDLPVIRWLMVRVIRTIRVEERTIKQDTPEIREAIAALDRGECVVIFPEGQLRRTEERVLKRFGRGVWQILSARPDTPVVACWIEGNWKSYTSYFGGRPTQNKKPDFRRRIEVGVSAPVTVEPDATGRHLPTRLELMNRVIAARAHLGLPVLPRYDLPTQAAEKDEEDEAAGERPRDYPSALRSPEGATDNSPGWSEPTARGNPGS